MPLSGNLIWQSGNNYVNKIWQYIVNCQPNCHEFGLVDVPKRK